MNIEPRHVYVVSFDEANTDLYYFCSHNDIILDGVASANIFYGDIVNASTFSQSLDPIRANANIGQIKFTFNDDDQALTALMNSKLFPSDSPLSSSEGLRAKRVQHWVGEKGGEWSADYKQIQTHQIHNAITVNNGIEYGFSGQDVQRSELEDIFEPKITNLTASITKTDITIPVNSTTGIDLIQHGASYSDAPNDLVLYIRIKDEIIRGTAKTATEFTVDNAQTTLNGAVAIGDSSIAVTDASSFDSSGIGYITSGSPIVTTEIRWSGISASPQNVLTGVTGLTAAHGSGAAIVNAKGRGILNTIAAAYTVDTAQSVSNRTKVTEHIYYELPAMKLAYAILTGTLYGSSPVSSIPSHHTLGISTDWVSTSQFTTVGNDIWDPSDDTNGIVLMFSGETKVNAKKFIEEQLNFLCGVFNPILPTGELGLKRMTGVLSDAAYTRILDEDVVTAISNVRYDFNDLHNNINIKWNYDAVQKIYTRDISLTDSTSSGRWGLSKTLEIKSRGLNGSRHTDNIISSLFNTWRNRYSAPPFKATVTLDYSQRDIKVGEIVRLKLDHLPEFTDQDGNYQTLDMSVEAQKVSVNHQTGTVTINVFGSTFKADLLSLGSDASPLDDAFFTGTGIDLSTVTTGVWSGGSPGTIWTITANSSITGVDDLSSASPNGIYYLNGDLINDVGVTLTTSKNVELRVNGFMTNNGAINGKGRGLTGGTTGQAGYIGNTRAGGGFQAYYIFVTGGVTFRIATQSDLVQGINSTMPSFILTNNAGASISGAPTNLMGSSGGKGGNITGDYPATGGQGANGGAGLVIYCKGASGGSNSSIDLSGNDGVVGGQVNVVTRNAQSGTGAGGAAGGLALFLVGNTVTETMSDFLVADNGSTEIVGEPLPNPAYVTERRSFVSSVNYSYYVGIGARSVRRSNLLVDYVPDNLTATADYVGIADTATAFTFTPNNNVPQTPAENLTTLDVAVTPPSGNDYSHSDIWYKVATDSEAQFQKLPYPAKNETSVTLAMDGTEYTFRAFPVNLDGVVSEDFIEENYTVSTATGSVVLASGNSVRTATDVASSGGVQLDNNGIDAYDGASPSVKTFDLDAATGQILAIDAVITGKGITLDAGGSLKSIGKTVGSGTGIFFGFNVGSSPGAYVLDVGDHANEKYIYFDGVDLNLGEETLIGGKVLYSGAVNSTGTAYGLPAGWSCVRTSTGLYTITHNLGLGSGTEFNELHITISKYKGSDTDHLSVGNITANTFVVDSFTSGGVRVNNFFFFHAHWKP